MNYKKINKLFEKHNKVVADLEELEEIFLKNEEFKVKIEIETKKKCYIFKNSTWTLELLIKLLKKEEKVLRSQIDRELDISCDFLKIIKNIFKIKK